MACVMEKISTQERPTTANPDGQRFDWHFGCPRFTAKSHAARNRESDAAALMAMLTSEEVAEFIRLCRTLEGSRIHCEVRRAACGQSFCFAIVPSGYEMRWACFR